MKSRLRGRYFLDARIARIVGSYSVSSGAKKPFPRDKPTTY